MKLSRIALMLCSLGLTAAAVAQAPSQESGPMPSPPKTAEVSLSSGTVSIGYNSPSARGRKIFGELVPYGKVWRTGANPATRFTTTTDLMVGDLKVPAGHYTLYSIPTADGWTLIINKQLGQWGLDYDQAQDLGRTKMKVGTMPAPLEAFLVDFEKTSGNSTELHLKWVAVDAYVAIKATK